MSKYMYKQDFHIIPSGFCYLPSEIFTPTINYKISETNFNFHVKEHTTGKVSSLFFGTFLLVLTKFLLWDEGGRRLGTRLSFYEV